MSYSLEERLQMMIRVGRRFNKIAIPSLIILIGTGIYNSYSFFNNFELLFSTSYGNLLTIKIILVMVLIITYIIHVRIIRKDIEEEVEENLVIRGRAEGPSPESILTDRRFVIISVGI